MLSFVGTLPGYEAWTGTVSLTPGVNDGAEENPDFDPYSNVLEYQLGGDPLAFDGDLVATSGDATHLIFTFERFNASETDSTLTFQWGTGLAIWNDVVVDFDGGTDGNGVEVIVEEGLGASGPEYDAVTVRLPKSLELSGRLFGRLQGTRP